MQQSNESAVGTFETCRAGLTMSVVRSRPEVAFRGHEDRDRLDLELSVESSSLGNRYEREPDFRDYPRRQERRCHPCSRISVCTRVWVDLLLRGKTAAKMSFFVHGTFRMCRSVRLSS
jgi:hypothetical protein